MCWNRDAYEQNARMATRDPTEFKESLNPLPSREDVANVHEKQK